MKAVVLGGSRGIGKAIATRLAADGAEVLICARSVDVLKATASEIGASYLSVDLGDRQQVAALPDQIVAQLGVPDALLLNGGGPPFGRLVDTTAEQWEAAVYQTVLSSVSLLRALVPRMEAGSSVVFVLSDATAKATANNVIPCALRLALLGIMKSLAVDQVAHGIRFNALSPGPIETQRARGLLQSSANSSGRPFDDVRADFLAGLPMKRMAEPSEIAELAAYLLSPRSSYVTGQNFGFDGGVTAGAI